MAIRVAGHFDFKPVEVEIGKHAIMGTACIIEGKLAAISKGSQLMPWRHEKVVLALVP